MQNRKRFFCQNIVVILMLVFLSACGINTNSLPESVFDDEEIKPSPNISEPTPTSVETVVPEETVVNEPFILYQPLDENYETTSELVVVNLLGEELHRFTFDNPVNQIVSTPANDRALVYTTEDQIYLLDVQRERARDLELTARVFPSAYPGGLASHQKFTGGERWAILGISPDKPSYLLSLETGQGYDLSSGGDFFVSFGLLAPNEDFFVFGGTGLGHGCADRGLRLISTNNLDAVRYLVDGYSFASFSSDSKQLTYSRSDSQQTEVVVEQVDGSKTEVVASEDKDFVTSYFVPMQNSLLLVRHDRLSILSLDDYKEQVILTDTIRDQDHWFAPDGRKLLFRYEVNGVQTWHFLDLHVHTDQVLTELAGYYYPSHFLDINHRWLFFSDDYERIRHLVSLDLESGQTHQIYTADDDDTFMDISDVSYDGQFVLVTIAKTDKQQLWLLQADTGSSKFLLEAPSVHGVFSPDGNWILVTGAQGREHQLAVLDIEGEMVRLLGAGCCANWTP